MREINLKGVTHAPGYSVTRVPGQLVSYLTGRSRWQESSLGDRFVSSEIASPRPSPHAESVHYDGLHAVVIAGYTEDIIRTDIRRQKLGRHFHIAQPFPRRAEHVPDARYKRRITEPGEACQVTLPYPKAPGAIGEKLGKCWNGCCVRAFAQFLPFCIRFGSCQLVCILDPLCAQASMSTRSGTHARRMIRSRRPDDE